MAYKIKTKKQKNEIQENIEERISDSFKQEYIDEAL
jgi:hypothetical protein